MRMSRWPFLYSADHVTRRDFWAVEQHRAQQQECSSSPIAPSAHCQPSLPATALCSMATSALPDPLPLRDSLRAHDVAFTKLLSLIPARYYLPSTDEEVGRPRDPSPRHWQLTAVAPLLLARCRLTPNS